MSQTPFHYVPGATVALASASVGVLLAAGADHPMIDAILDELSDTSTVDDVLDLLLRGGLRNLPDFACAELTRDGVRFVVRGVATAAPEGGEAVACSTGPWCDGSAVARGVVLRAGDAASGRRMPFRGGMVLAAELILARTDAPAPAPGIGEAPDAVTSPDEASVVTTPAASGPALAAAKMSASTLVPPSAEDDEEPIDFDFLFNSTAPPSAPPLSPTMPQGDPEHSVPPEMPHDEGMTSPSPYTADISGLTPPAAERPVAPRLIEGLPWEQAVPFPAFPQQAPEQPQALRSPGAPPTVTPFASPTAWPPQPSVSPSSPLAFTPAPPAAVEDPLARTVSRAQLRGNAPMVLAVRCAQGHLSPAFAAVCRVCGESVPPQQHFEVQRPVLGLLRLSTGAIVQLDRAAIIGRNPRIPPDYVGSQPNLVQVVDPERDVSGQHLEVTLDFWNVVVRDLGSTNGTEVVLPGAMPVALRPQQPMILEPGGKVVMAGSVSFVFEATA